MKEKYHQVISERYQDKESDFNGAFETVLVVGDEIGLERALGYLERCVIEKRLGWLDDKLDKIEKTGDVVEDGYRIFYEEYLGISVPKDGEVVDKTDKKMVMRWWNYCPILESCKKFGLDTRVVCKKAYHKPVQIFLSRIDSRLKFDRNYDSIRPYTPYCEEIITLEK
ncbi:hypothetical protein GTN66_07710 [bacterium]|nr:hypothetical protein [bacterium]NIN93360.1 hypothetical protein [bacterium]NIO19143.1 hypothetical protein [bacterium]NIO74277.1 hypothetical protein [bacterium]